MKVKHRIKYCVAIVTFLMVAGGVGVAIWSPAMNIEPTQAYITEEYLREYNSRDDLIYGLNDSNNEAYFENVRSNESDGVRYYDSRDHYGVRTKNQHSEGICGIYSMTTTLEYAIAERYNENIEVSPKHLDYQLVKAETAYKDSGVRNAYFDRYADAHPEYGDRELGKGSAQYLMLFGLANPFAIMSEGDFTRALKANDSRINSINRYEDIWGLDGHNEWLDEGRYTVKQDFAAMNNPENTKYVVTGMGLIRYPYYGSRDDRDDVIETIKNTVKMYGAVDITAHIDVDNCAYERQIDGRSRYTLIDRGSSCDAETNHGMVIVGWDDDWWYYDGETRKTGAFILQNSWGEGENDKMKWYLGYDSRFSGVYFDSIERYDDYSHYYGVFDYRDQIVVEPEQDEYIFDFAVEGGDKKIKGFTFNEHNNSYEYKIYLADDVTKGDFTEIGTFESEVGMDRYAFNDEVIVNGDYAIKLKRTDGSNISDTERKVSIMNTMADDIWTLKIDGSNGEVRTKNCKVNNGRCSVVLDSDVLIREGYSFRGYADSASATKAEYQPGDTIVLTGNKNLYAVWTNNYDPTGEEDPSIDDDNDDDIFVPSTSAMISDSSAPQTGVNVEYAEHTDGSDDVLSCVSLTLVAAILFGVGVKSRNKTHRRFD